KAGHDGFGGPRLIPFKRLDDALRQFGTGGATLPGLDIPPSYDAAVRRLSLLPRIDLGRPRVLSTRVLVRATRGPSSTARTPMPPACPSPVSAQRSARTPRALLSAAAGARGPCRAADGHRTSPGTPPRTWRRTYSPRPASPAPSRSSRADATPGNT